VSLEDWGWSEAWAKRLPEQPGFEPARVVGVHGRGMVLAGAGEEFLAPASGRLLDTSPHKADLPTVGDWVLVRGGVVEGILPRTTLVSRRAPGSGAEKQALAANVDLLFIVSGLDLDLNVRRLERYLIVALESGARPVLVLNKADLGAPEEALQAVLKVAAGHEVLLTSATRGTGTHEVAARLGRGVTGAFVGSSGVGKSTLVNRLLGLEAQAVRDVRPHDSRGRHTTTSRRLFRLPTGGLVIDSPGLREIQVFASEETLASGFPEIAALARGCRFRDCRHLEEPGCAVSADVLESRLDPGRLESFHKLRREAERAEREEDAVARARHKGRVKSLERMIRRKNLGKRGRET
jgi:ribosome biogenesis GTPase